MGNVHRGKDSQEKWKEIPDDTDILITHGPALGYGDTVTKRLSNIFVNRVVENHTGCVDLLHEVLYRIKPKLHVAGHIHDQPGCWQHGDIRFVQAATCNNAYKPINE